MKFLSIFQAVIAHTEDGCPEWKDYGYVVNAHIKPTERNGYTEERFIAFCYPGEHDQMFYYCHWLVFVLKLVNLSSTSLLAGMLPGYAYSVNQYGLVITGNVVKSNEIYTKGRIGKTVYFKALFFILGYLPGSAFSVNSHGLAVTGNIVIPTKVYWKERLGKQYVWNPFFSRAISRVERLYWSLWCRSDSLVVRAHKQKNSYFLNFIRFQKF